MTPIPELLQPQTPQTPISPTPNSKDTKGHKGMIIAAIATLAIVGSTVYSFGGAYFQGKLERMPRAEREAKLAESKPQLTRETIKTAPAKKSITLTVPAPEKTTDTGPYEEPIPGTEANPVILDESKLGLTFKPYNIKNTNNVIAYNKGNAFIGDFFMQMPVYKTDAVTTKTSYLQPYKFEFCNENGANCYSLKSDSVTVFKATPSTKNYKLLAQDFGPILIAQGYEDNDVVGFRYSVTDPSGVELKSNIINFTLQDELAPLSVNGGGALFGDISMEYDKSVNSAAFNGSKIQYNPTSKQGLRLNFNLPTYAMTDGENTKDSYIQPLSLQLCNADFSSCKNVKESTRTIFSTTTQTESTNKDQYTLFSSTLQFTELASLIEELKDGYENKFFFRYTIKDPTGIDLYTNSFELVTP